MGVDIIGLLLAVLTAIIAALVMAFLPTLVWSSLGIYTLPLTMAAALLILALGAAVYAAISNQNHSQ